MNCAICEDDVNDLRALAGNIRAYNALGAFTIHEYRNGAALLTAIEKGKHFDIVFLNIPLPGFSGLEAAEQIRRSDSTVCIILTSCTADFAMHGYDVEAFSYLIKPINKNKLTDVLDRAVMRLMEMPKAVQIQTHDGSHRINAASIIYVEKAKKKVILHLCNGATILSRLTLNETFQKLRNASNFIVPYQCYIINMLYITEINKARKELTLNHHVRIPIARDRLKGLLEAYAHSVETGS